MNDLFENDLWLVSHSVVVDGTSVSHPEFYEDCAYFTLNSNTPRYWFGYVCVRSFPCDEDGPAGSISAQSSQAYKQSSSLWSKSSQVMPLSIVNYGNRSSMQVCACHVCLLSVWCFYVCCV